MVSAKYLVESLNHVVAEATQILSAIKLYDAARRASLEEALRAGDLVKASSLVSAISLFRKKALHVAAARIAADKLIKLVREKGLSPGSLILIGSVVRSLKMEMYSVDVRLSLLLSDIEEEVEDSVRVYGIDVDRFDAADFLKEVYSEAEKQLLHEFPPLPTVESHDSQ